MALAAVFHRFTTARFKAAGMDLIEPALAKQADNQRLLRKRVSGHLRVLASRIRQIFGLAMLLVLAAAVGGPAAQAETALYEAEVPWSDRDADSRAGAFRQALRQVIVKVTGRRGFADATSIDSLVENAQAFVQQYQLRTVESGFGEASVPEPSLWARFDEEAVGRLLREAGLVVWSSPRPPVLVWLAMQSGESMLTAGSEGTEATVELLRLGAASRGASMILPLLDLQDLTLAGAPEFWVEAEERIRAASERYRPGSILVGRIERGVLWEARWSLLLPGAAQRWTSGGDVLDLVVDDGFQEALDALVSHYTSAVPPEKGGAAIAVSVSGVHDFAAYVRTVRYLESLGEVESVEVLAVVSGRVRLGLKLRTGVAGLRELIALDSTLAEDAGDVDGALALRLLP